MSAGQVGPARICESTVPWRSRAMPLALLFSIVAMRSGVAESFDCNQDFVPGRVLVRFQPGAAAAAKRDAHASAAGAEVLRQFRGIDGLQLVRVQRGREQAAVAAYRASPVVRSASPDYVMRFDASPNDAYYSSHLWAMHNNEQELTGPNCTACPDPGTSGADIRADRAWDVWQGPADGAFRVAVIDTGVKYDHPDLRDNMWVNPIEDLNHNGVVDGEDHCNANPPSQNGDFNCIDDDGNGYRDDIVGYDFGDDDADPMDQAGHGTHIAGTIAGRGNNATGVAGVMWRAKLVALRVAAQTGGCSAVSDNIDAIQYCIINEIKVINASWGGGLHCPALYDVIASAKDHGILFVASAGNNGTNNDGPATHHYPANYGWTHTHLQPPFEYSITGLPNVIAVAATDNDDLRASFGGGEGSNYGPQSVHLAGPGKNIWSTWYTPSFEYLFNSGTSMAAPHVVGVAGLVWSRMPTLTYLEVKEQILSSVRPIPVLHPQSTAGGVASGGIIDAYRSVLWACSGSCGNPLCRIAEECPNCPDCNTNGVYDGCDIAAGVSCDRDANGLPDECGACCIFGFPYTCGTMTEAACSLGEGTFTAGTNCTGSPTECGDSGSCCLPGASTCISANAVSCAAQGGRFHIGFCSPPAGNACSTGICCDPTNICSADATPTSCGSQETYFGGGQSCGVPCPFRLQGCADSGCPVGQECCCDGQCASVCNDCNDNGIDDDQDLQAGTSADCNNSDTPDECDTATCAGDASCLDCDENGVPDICQGSGDADFDCIVDGDDLGFFVDCLGGPEVKYPEGMRCIYLDMDHDHDVDTGGDYQLLSNAWNTTSPACDGSAPPACDTNYTSVVISSTLESGTDASIFPNPLWQDQVGLEPAGKSLVYNQNASMVELSVAPSSSFMFWAVDGVPQIPGETTLEVSPRDDSRVTAVYACSSLPAPTADGIAKNRFLSFSVGDSWEPTAIRVKLVALHHPANPPPNTPDFAEFEGSYRYVTTFKNAIGAAVFMCPDDGGPSADYRCARLGCEPEYRDWYADFGGSMIHVTGPEILPSSQYHVQLIGESCSGNETGYSSSLVTGTGPWGDVATMSATGPPDGVVNVLDVSAMVSKLKQVPDRIPERHAWLADVAPWPYAAGINVLNVSYVVDALKGLAFPASLRPCPCPSTALCGGQGSTECDSAFQCNGLCIDADGPGGDPGYCTDACGRCTTPTP